MKSKLAVTLTLTVLSLVVVACGGGEPSGQTETAAEPAAQSGPSEAAQAGIAVGEEIIATYEALVMATAEALKEQPEWADVEPQLVALRDEYEGKMAELHTKFIALREADVESFGAAVSHVQDNRGKVIDLVYRAHDSSVVQYRLQKGETEVNEFLSTLPRLLDVATDTS